MTKKVWCVRIVQTHTPEGKEVHEGGEIGLAFIECLRYAGLIRNHPINDPNSLTSVCFDLLPPRSVGDSKNWAEMNAQRMQTFGFNAVAAPDTGE